MKALRSVVLISGLGALLLAAAAYSGTLTRTSAFEYDPSTGLLTRQIIEPDNANLCLVTTYTYDAFGNQTSATTSNCAGATGRAVFASRTTSTGYDAQGRFATSSSNALNHTETRAFSAAFGTMTALTGPNSLSTTWDYDGFGRRVLESRADGTSSAWSYSLCDASCAPDGRYVVSVAASGAPQSKTTYDSLNREVRSETQGFDGTWVRKDTEYDTLGRVSRVSKPYFAGQSIAWTAYGYDLLGRVSSVTEPATAAGTLVSSIGYSGLATTVTLNTSPAQSRTTVRNSQGQTVSVTDALNNQVLYYYDPFGNLVYANAAGVASGMAYDLRGRKTQMVDYDMGTWFYDYNALGELVWQKDAKNQESTLAYDRLGRLTQRGEPDHLASWSYDTCATGIGKLCQASASNNYSRTLLYDALGRLSLLTTTIDAPYTVATSYDAAGRLDTLTYPSGFAVRHLYNGYGYLHKLQRADAGGSTVFWQANALDAMGNVSSETLGNGLTTTRSYDSRFRLTQLLSGSVHHLAYAYDLVGNLTQRTDSVNGVSESFSYDGLNRLTGVSGAGLATRSFEYTASGNLAYKSDVGSYSYPGASAARPHAVRAVSGGGNPNSITASYGYDGNGNLKEAWGTVYPASGAAAFSRTLSYKSFNAPAMIYQALGAASYTYLYLYDAEQQRVKLTTVRPDDTLSSIYLHPGGKGALLYEKESRASGPVEQRHYLSANGRLVGVHITRNDATEETRYFHRDAIESLNRISNAAGGAVESFGYEAFGERRNPNGTAQNRASPLLGITTDRGFTGHEHLDELNLIHMNGRVYDPALGRFMTPDPYLQHADNLQDYNRYSYGLNNPLNGVDLTGYSWWTDFRDSVLKPAAAIAVAVYAPQISAAVGWTEGAAALGITSGRVASGILGGAIAGGILGGDLRSTIVGGATGGMFGAVGDIWPTGWQNIVGHAAVGCASSLMNSGGCGPGALSAGFSAAATPLVSGWGVVGGTVASAVIGGTASVLGGGRFANGATTASFGYLFNELQHYDLGITNPQKSGYANFLDDQFIPRLKRWRELAGEQGIDLVFTEGYRTAEAQARVQGIGGVRPAEISLHQSGFAVDISIRGLTQPQLRLVVDLARQAGLNWGGTFRGNYDPYHFYRDPGGNRAGQARDAEIRYRQLIGP